MAPVAQPDVTVKVPGVAKKFALLPIPDLSVGCEWKTPMDVMPLPAGARKATFVIEMPTLPDGGRAPGRPRGWRFGVYEWTSPATMAAAPRPAEPPKSFGRRPEFTLLEKKSVTWPAAREVTVTVPNTSRRVAIIAFCDGDIAARFTLDGRVNGRLTMLGRLCGRMPNPDRGGYGTLGSEQPRGKTVTISVRVKTDIPEYLRRPGTLTLAVYQG